MITIYFQEETVIQSLVITPANPEMLEKAIWIDVASPTKKEEALLENILEIDVPTKKEMEEIEPSSRLYVEDEALFMTTTMVAYSDLPIPRTDVVTFILLKKQLITIRYSELYSFKVFTTRLLNSKKKKFIASSVLLGLLDSVTERLADILEKISHAFDEISQNIFHPDTSNGLDYKTILQRIGANGDLGAKARESVVSLIRLISFLEQTEEASLSASTYSHLKILKNDIQALSDFAGFISTKVNFLLDATLGMINIDQNNIIKIFSIAAVIFLPPTLIASLYGMNFKYMPELDWHWGYPLAILLMFLSAWAPYQFFKKKKWI